MMASSLPGLAALLPAALLLLVSGLVARAIAEQISVAQIDEMDAYNAGALGNMPNRTYYSSPIISPSILVNAWNEAAMTDYTHLMISPSVAGQPRTPMVFSARDLSLVYADPERGGSNPQLQTLGGKEYLTLWTGSDMKGWGTGGGVILNESFDVMYNLTTQDLDTGADNHEFQLTHDGGALLNNYHTTVFDVTSVGGPPDGLLQDCAFQEVDVATGEVRFTWRATDHFDLEESFGDPYDLRENGWDWFHMNSQFKTRDGNYLISSRHLRTIALLDGTTGDRIWQLGGQRNSFLDLSDGRATDFAYQHHARFVDDSYTEVTFYDNHVMHPSAPTPGCEVDCSRGMRVKLDFDAMTAELVHELYHPVGVQAWAQGGYQTLPGGGALISWGTVPALTEFSADGEVVMDLQLGPWFGAEEGVVNTYRVYKANWTAQPRWRPEIAVVGSVVYVTWNGATEVASWSLSGGDDPLELEPLGSPVPKTGFETEIIPPKYAGYYRAAALNSDGKILDSTLVIEVATGTKLAGKRLPKIKT